MIYTYNKDEYERLIAEIKDDIFDNLLERYPDLIDSVEEYANGEISIKMLLKRLKNKFSDELRYEKFDMSVDDDEKQFYIDESINNAENKSLHSQDNEHEPSADPYHIMLRYISGDKNSLEKLYQTNTFEGSSIKDKAVVRHEFADKNLNVMLKNAVYNYGLEYKKEEGWIKRFVAPVDSQDVESIFNEVLFELISGQSFIVNKIGDIDYNIIDSEKIFPFERITDSGIFYKQLKYIVIEIVNKRYGKRDGKLKSNDIDSKGKRRDIPFAYEIYDTVTNFNVGEDDEYSLSLSDKQIYNDYITNQADCVKTLDEVDICEKLFFKPEPNYGYQYPYNSRLKNIENMNIDSIPYFTDEQKKYVKLLIEKHKVNENDMTDEDFIKMYFKKSTGIYKINYKNVGLYFNVTDKSVIEMTRKIRNGYLKYFDEYGYGNIKNKLSFTFDVQYLMWLHNHLGGEGQSDFFNAEDIETGKINLSQLKLFTKYVKEHDGLLIDIFNDYYNKFESGTDFKGKPIDKRQIKTIVYSVMGGNNILLKPSEACILFFELSRCIACYLDEMSNYIDPDNMYWDDDDIYKEYEYLKSGEYHEYLENTSEKIRQGIGYDYIKKCQYKPFIHLWEIKYVKKYDSNILFFYKVKNTHFREWMSPQRSKETLSYAIGYNWEIKYNLMTSDKSFYLIDNINKRKFQLFNEDRAEMNGHDKKVYVCKKFI